MQGSRTARPHGSRTSGNGRSANREDDEGARTDASLVRAYETSREERADAVAEHDANSAAQAAGSLARTREAIERDNTARLRDQGALSRDDVAEQRDRAAEHHAAELADNGGPPRKVIQALRQAGTAQREKAAIDRRRAEADRARAAGDRAQAALDRRRARMALQSAYLDGLTGVYTRALGLLTLQHEIDRAHRSGEPLVLAFIDVDALKAVNDRDGHAAGDTLLWSVATVIKSKVRSYDPIVRMGGDEFLCGFTNTALAAAARRVAEMSAALEQSQPAGSISVGLAELEPDETLEALIARADAGLYREKRSR